MSEGEIEDVVERAVAKRLPRRAEAADDEAVTLRARVADLEAALRDVLGILPASRIPPLTHAGVDYGEQVRVVVNADRVLGKDVPRG